MAKIKRKQLNLTLSDYDDVFGLFNSANLANDDTMEEAFSKIVRILDALVPPSAPDLSAMTETIATAGVTGNLSFGPSNIIADYNNHPTIDANATYTATGNSLGIFTATTPFTATLNDQVTASPSGTYGGTPSAAYDNDAFGNADLGTLQLYLDGDLIHSVDLTTFDTGNSYNANGSGFTLSASQASKFSTGTDFDNFQFRTGTVRVDPAEWGAGAGFGYHTVQVRHDIDGDVAATQTFNFVIDNYTGAVTATGATLGGLAMTGSRFLSGVEYHQAGTAAYSVTLANVYRNTYEEGNAITFGGTRASSTAQAIPAFTGSEADDVVITDKLVTISSSNTRILGQDIMIRTNVDRTVQSNANNLGQVNAFSLLLDTITAASTDTSELFNTETYRMSNAIEDNLTTTAGYASGGANPFPWDSTQSLVGANANYNDGLMVFNGQLRYPTNTAGTGIATGNFAAVADGPTNNVNYSGATGLRTYYRYYYLPSGQNFQMNLTATTTTVVPATTTPTGNNINIEILAPNVTRNAANAMEWKDTRTAFSIESGVGAYAATYGGNAGNTSGANWGLTLGELTTSNSGNVLIVRITAAATWAGNIETLNLIKL